MILSGELFGEKTTKERVRAGKSPEKRPVFSCREQHKGRIERSELLVHPSYLKHHNRPGPKAKDSHIFISENCDILVP